MNRPTAQSQQLALAVLGTGLALGIVLQVIQILRSAGVAG
jgi:hypothetical protein